MIEQRDRLNSSRPIHSFRVIFGLIVCGLIMVIAGGINLIASEKIEERILNTSTLTGDSRWMVHLVCAIVCLLICLAGIWQIKNRRVVSILRLWLSAAILMILTTPIKLLFMTAQNLTALIRIAAMLVILLMQILTDRKMVGDKPQIRHGWLFNGMVFFTCCLIALPWVIWGALGSWLDSTLALLSGFVFAFFATRSIFSLIPFSIDSDKKSPSSAQLVGQGLILCIFLFICVSSLAGNGAEVVMALTIPVCGLFVPLIVNKSRKQADQGRGATAFLLGVVFSLPLLYFDMDELILPFNRIAGETFDWAIKCALLTFLLIVFLWVLGIAFRHKRSKFHLQRQWKAALVTVGCAGLLAAYFGWGQVGVFGDHQLVILRQQADLRDISAIKDISERRNEVFARTTMVANSTQQTLRAKLDRWGVTYTPFYLVNALDVNGGDLSRLFLLNDPDVERILESPRLRPLPEDPTVNPANRSAQVDSTPWNLTMIHAERVWNELGVNGSGVVIGLADSGIDGSHPDLSGTYRGFSSGDETNWYDPWYGSLSPVDWGSHGTEVLGVILGQKTGVAPGAQWIGCVNLGRNLGNPADYLTCMQFLFAPYPHDGNSFKDADPSKGANILNNSWDCPRVEGCDPWIFNPAVDALKTAGVFISVAAGNNGELGCSSVTDPPAIYPQVMSVGSIDRNGERSIFSSLGPVVIDGSQRVKPDLMAPGEDIFTTSPAGLYAYASGTSFSAPHVTGVVALMWSANPALIGNIDATMQILQKTATPITNERIHCGTDEDLVGSGILDAYAAVEEALSLRE